jgi:type VI secretion system protein ImpH
MAAESGTESATVARSDITTRLTEAPTSFGFFQVVRLLERLFPERKRVGESGDPSEEVVRFTVNPAIGFPPSEVRVIELLTEPPEMAVNFMGLVGPLGVLPYHYSLLVADRARLGDRSMKAFLDLFHHRIISLFYLAWERHRFMVAYERDRRDRVTEHLLDFIGLGLQGFQNRLPVVDESLVFYAGLLGPQQRSAEALQRMLEDYFGIPVEVEQFIGGWYPLPAATHCTLGEETGSFTQLGRGAVVGDAVWDQQARVRIKLGPLTRAQYEEFLPEREAYLALRALTRFFSDDRFDFEVQLILARGDVPGCTLEMDDGAGLRLGWFTWISSKPFAHDPDDTILSL